MPREVFVAGQVLTAAELNVVSDQSVMVFAGTAVRGAAITSPTEGMVTYLEDEDELQVYTTEWGGVGRGKILQVVSTTKTDTFSTASNTLTQVTGLTATITPSSASNKILVIAKLSMGVNPSLTAGAAALRRAGTSIFLGDSAGSRNTSSSAQIPSSQNYQFDMNMVHLDSPNTTSSIIYDVAVTNAEQDGSTVFVNRGAGDADSATKWRTASSITLMEVAG